MPAATARMLLGSLALVLGARSAAETPGLSHRQLSRSRVDERVLALAFVGERRILALAAGSISVWRLDDGALRPAARATWPLPPLPVRHGGGVIVGVSEEGAAWLASSYLAGAQLVRVDGPRLVLGDVAQAAPWPGAPEGLRFRPGTNLVDGIEGLPLVAVDPVSRAVVREDGMLMVDSAAAGFRVGSAVASLWADTLVASAPGPPALGDTLLVLRRSDGLWKQWSSMPVPGTVTAMAARAGARSADVVVALHTPAGAELLRLEVRTEP
jgi:hypothetical protein